MCCADRQAALGEEADEEDEDWAEEEAEEEGGYFRLGEQDEQFHDYSALPLKDDHANRCAACSAMH